MNTHTTHPGIDTTDPRFLGPEAGQQAAREAQGKEEGGAGGKAEANARTVQAHELGDMRTILHIALTQPGVMNQAYRAFHNYSIGNQLLAAVQLLDKGLPLAPIASFNAWRAMGRFVKKGEKAISLFMPVSVKRRADKDTPADATEKGEGGTVSVFMLRPNWFSLTQTEGDEFVAETVTPAWDAGTAMAALNIGEEPFARLQGNHMGYARARTIGINPLNRLKHKTRFHEMAHVVLGHTADADMYDHKALTRQLQEAEAEGVAYLLCTLLGLPGQAESRSYIQGWLEGAELPEKSAKRIFGAADRIMKAGQPVRH
jgi:hypothetical protein